MLFVGHHIYESHTVVVVLEGVPNRRQHLDSISQRRLL